MYLLLHLLHLRVVVILATVVGEGIPHWVGWPTANLAAVGGRAGRRLGWHRFGDAHRGDRAAAGGNCLSSTGLSGVVLAPIVVGIKEFLEPLQKLKVILEAALDEFIYHDFLQKRTMVR